MTSATSLPAARLLVLVAILGLLAASGAGAAPARGVTFSGTTFAPVVGAHFIAANTLGVSPVARAWAVTLTRQTDANSSRLRRARGGPSFKTVNFTWSARGSVQSVCLGDVAATSYGTRAVPESRSAVEHITLYFATAARAPGPNACGRLDPAHPVVVRLLTNAAGGLWARVDCQLARCRGSLRLLCPGEGCPPSGLPLGTFALAAGYGRIIPVTLPRRLGGRHPTLNAEVTLTGSAPTVSPVVVDPSPPAWLRTVAATRAPASMRSPATGVQDAGQSPGPASPQPGAADPATVKPAHLPQSFLAVSNYAQNQPLYSGDLDVFNTRWWSGGIQISDIQNQGAMLRNGYHFLPSFNTGYLMRRQGLTTVSPGTTKDADPHSCVDTPCALNTAEMLAEVQIVQHAFPGPGNYYDVGNEVDNSSSDDVAPSVFPGQFDAWVAAIKQGDPTAKIVAPSIDTWSCCATASTNPYGTAGQWFRAFVLSYEQQHGGAAPPIDVLSMHLYDFDPSTAKISGAEVDNYLAEVQSFRQTADALGYAGKPIWITELGFAYQPPGPMTEAQSGQIAQVVRQLAANAASLDLQRMFWITSTDQAFTGIGLRPLYDPAAGSSPAGVMPLTDLGLLVSGLASDSY